MDNPHLADTGSSGLLAKGGRGEHLSQKWNTGKMQTQRKAEKDF